MKQIEKLLPADPARFVEGARFAERLRQIHCPAACPLIAGQALEGVHAVPPLETGP